MVTWIFVVFCFDYPREGANKAPGGLVLDSVWSDETQAQFRAAQLSSNHDEAWVEPQVLNDPGPSGLVSLEDSTLTVHVMQERAN